MLRKKNALHLMTWKEAKEAFSMDPVVLIPLGSMEEHGPHSITGDFLAATEIVKSVAQKTGALYIPVIPFGCSEYFRGYPGTISLSQNTVISILQDICDSLIEHGISKIVFFNGHAGNAAAIEQTARKIRREKGIMVASIDLWQSLSDDFKKELYGEENPFGHGGEPLTSVMMYLYPEEMRLDLLNELEARKEWRGFKINALAKSSIEQGAFSLFFNMEDISTQGVMGNPFVSSAENGKAIVNRIVEIGTEVVEKVMKTDMKPNSGRG